MRVLLLNQSFPPDSTATAQHLADIARHLRDLGHQVHVVADRRPYEQRGDVYAPREMWEGVDVRRVRSTAFGKRSFTGRFFDGITFLVFTAWELAWLPTPNLVVSFTSPPLIGLLGLIYAKIARAKSVQWLMDLNIDAAIATGHLDERSLIARFLLWFFRLSLKGAQHVIVEDRYTAERAIRRGARPQTIAIIPPWPAHDPSPAASAGHDFRAKNGIADDFVVMYSGNHAKIYPLDTLLEAARRLDGEGFLFVFIGGGDRVREVTEAVQRHRLRNVRQLPLQPRETLAESLAAADLHVVIMADAMNGLGHPSKMYGVLATGTPYVFIGPKKSFAGDILAECPFGFSVEHGNAERLVEILQIARSMSSDERRTYRQANRTYLAERFGRDRSMAIFDSAILSTLQASASRTHSQM